MKDDPATPLTAATAATLTHQAIEQGREATAQALVPAIATVERAIRLAIGGELYTASVPYSELGLESPQILALKREFEGRGFTVRTFNDERGSTDESSLVLGWQPSRPPAFRTATPQHLLEGPPRIGGQVQTPHGALNLRSIPGGDAPE